MVNELKRGGYTPQVLGRSAKSDLQWDGRTLGPWREALEGAEAVINLVGENVAQPWTAETKMKIVASRVDATAVLAKAISEAKRPPCHWVQGSAVGFYGDRGEALLTEASAAGPKEDFLVSTCLAWEAALDSAATPHTKKVIIRTGFVIGGDGGAFPLLAKLTRAFLGGAVGSGKQWVPWIHVDDLARMMVWAIGRTGILNGAAPEPVRNGELMATMRKVIGRPWSPPAPRLALQAFRALGGPEPAVATLSTRATPQAALDAGFSFQHSNLEDAIRLCLNKP